MANFKWSRINAHGIGDFSISRADERIQRNGGNLKELDGSMVAGKVWKAVMPLTQKQHMVIRLKGAQITEVKHNSNSHELAKTETVFSKTLLQFIFFKPSLPCAQKLVAKIINFAEYVYQLLIHSQILLKGFLTMSFELLFCFSLP
jgi:hypothetical protein